MDFQDATSSLIIGIYSVMLEPSVAVHCFYALVEIAIATAMYLNQNFEQHCKPYFLAYEFALMSED